MLDRRWMSAPLVCFVFSALPSAAQTPPPVSLPGTEFHDFVAKDGVHYDLRIALASASGSEGHARYPVLYLIDGFMMFAAAAQIHGVMRLGGEVEPMILVGVDRHYDSTKEWAAGRLIDLTPSSLPEVELADSRRLGREVRTGGAGEFQRVLIEEIIPWVEDRYPVSEVRGLVGDSLGGLFAARVLLRSPKTFSRYMILSPSLWWGGGAIFEEASRELATMKELSARVFLAVGELEEDEEVDMVADMRRFARILRQRDLPGLALQTALFPDETHLSVPSASFSRGLRFLFAPVEGPP